jgi:hypothetical protein
MARVRQQGNMAKRQSTLSLIGTSVSFKSPREGRISAISGFRILIVHILCNFFGLFVIFSWCVQWPPSPPGNAAEWTAPTTQAPYNVRRA